MTNRIGDDSDEVFAAELLTSYLESCGMTNFCCELNVSDPPDIIVKFRQGEKWGIEVTRALQQVKKIGNNKIISSEGIGAFFEKFSDELKEETRCIRHRSYTIYLEMPGNFNISFDDVKAKSWKKETGKLVRDHIESGASDVLRFPGGKLTPHAPGDGWRAMFGHPIDNVDVAIEAMLRCSLLDKMRNLHRWKSSFDQCWLVILNCYILADDVTEVDRLVRIIIHENAELPSFDGILWSGCRERTLVPIL